MITIVNVDESNPRHSEVTLSALPTAAWAGAFKACVEWAKGGNTPPGLPPGEIHIGEVARQSEYILAGDRIAVTLRPPVGTTYADVAGFVDQAIEYANQQSAH